MNVLSATAPVKLIGMPRYACATEEAAAPSTAVVVVPPAPSASAGPAGTGVAVIVSAKPQTFRIGAQSGGVPKVPLLRSRISNSNVAYMPPTIVEKSSMLDVTLPSSVRVGLNVIRGGVISTAFDSSGAA